jgi:hypothetical protein
MKLHCSNELKKTYPAEFRSWSLMWNRCENENNPDWPAYGGRGIVVEDETWSEFSAFLEAVKERPEPKSAYCLARIDKTKGYFLSNVRWRDRKQTCENYNHYQRRQTHCKRGHEFSLENRVRAGSRQCAKCARLMRRSRREKAKRNTKDFDKCTNLPNPIASQPLK